MRFKDIEVFGFGKIKDNLKIPLAEKINVILAPNDKGKSTLIEFIHAILYPFGDLKTDIGKKKRVRFKPWNSDIYGGRVNISLHKGGDYRIEKIIESSPREDRLGVFEFKNGSFSTLKISKQDKYLGPLIGDQFLNISRDVFESLSMVRQFDVAAIGESKKILDEVRSIIEIGKSGGGLTGALKKIQDKKTKVGLFEKRGKRTIAGSKQIAYDQVVKDIDMLKQQFDKNKQLLLDRRGLELKLEELKSDLDLKLIPKIKKIKERLSCLFTVIKNGYESIPLMVREMDLKDFQSFKRCGGVIKSYSFDLKSIDDNIITTKKTLKHNMIIVWLAISGIAIFSMLYFILNIEQARHLFSSLAIVFLISSLYFLRLIKKDNNIITSSIEKRENIKSEMSAKISELGILENIEEPKEIEFYEQLWKGLLAELNIKDLEELESIWYQSRYYSDAIKSFFELDIGTSDKKNIDIELDFNNLDSDISVFKDAMRNKKNLEDDIKNTQINIDMIDKTIESYLPKEDISILIAEESRLKDELSKIAIYKEALDIASQTLQEAGEELYSEVSPYINDFINKHFSCLSEDYDFVKVDADLSIYLKPKNHTDFISIERIGKGMQSSLYLLLRFAIISLFKLNSGEQLPFILDETLNVLDDFGYNHQERLLQLLLDLCYEYDVQMVYLTCQRRGQYLPIRDFFENRSLILKEDVVRDFTILQGGKDENEFN